MSVKIKNPNNEGFLRVSMDNNVAVIRLNGEDMTAIHFETPFGTQTNLNAQEKLDLTEAILQKLTVEGVVYLEEETEDEE